MKVIHLVKRIDKMRRTCSPGNWVQYDNTFLVDGVRIAIHMRCFETHLRVLDINGVDYSSERGMSVTEFNAYLDEVLSEAVATALAAKGLNAAARVA